MKNKKAEGVFGLSFGMIWSIILIVFFVLGAFMGIRTFLNYQDKTTLGFFLTDLDNSVKKAFYAESTNYIFKSTLPAGIEYVCFMNFTSKVKNPNDKESMVWNYVTSTYYEPDMNLYLYSPTKDYDISFKKISYIHTDRNPLCVKVTNKKISIRIEKKFEEAFVRLSDV
jgi:hypothetical protein